LRDGYEAAWKSYGNTADLFHRQLQRSVIHAGHIRPSLGDDRLLSLFQGDLDRQVIFLQRRVRLDHY